MNNDLVREIVYEVLEDATFTGIEYVIDNLL